MAIGFSSRFLAGGFLCLSLGAAFAYAAPPAVTSVFPAGMQRGQTATVTLSGTLPQWPATIVASTPALQIAPGKEKGQLQITAAASGCEGLHFLRVVDDGGASAPIPFLVGTATESLEVEPNNNPKTAQVVTLPSVVNGKLQAGGDSDAFRVKLKAGESLVAAIDARCHLGSPVDAVLQVCDDQGFVLAQNNDARGLDPLLVYVAPKEGEFLVRVFGFDAEPNASIVLSGNANMVYRLTLGLAPLADFGWPLAVPKSGGTIELSILNVPAGAAPLSRVIPAAMLPLGQGIPRTHLYLQDEGRLGVIRVSLRDFPCITKEQATGDVAVPVSISGRFQSKEDKHVYRLKAAPKSKVQVKVLSVSEEYQADPFVSIRTSTDQKLAEQDDAGEKRDCELTVAVPDDGIIVVHIHDFLGEIGPRHVYELQVVPQVPSFQATTTINSIDAAPDKPATIPVAIQRIEGFAGEVEVSIVGLPEGWTAPAVTSVGGKDTAAEVKLLLTPTAEAKPGFVRIVARAKEAPAGESEVLFYQTLGAVKVGFAEVYLVAPKVAK